MLSTVGIRTRNELRYYKQTAVQVAVDVTFGLCYRKNAQ